MEPDQTPSSMGYSSDASPAAIFPPEPEVFVSSSTFEVSDVEFCILHLRQAFVDAQVNLLN